VVVVAVEVVVVVVGCGVEWRGEERTGEERKVE